MTAYPNWLGGAQALPQINTITLASVTAGDVYTITIGNAGVSYTVSGGDTATTAAANLVLLLNAATAPAEFADAAWTSAVGVITMTGIAGLPITQTSSAVGTGTATTATVQTATGPNFWSNAGNQSDNAVPVTGDIPTVAGGSSTADVLYGLAQSAVTLAALTINSPSVEIGLPQLNPGQQSAGYPEYRPTYLAIGATICEILSASGRVKLNFGSVQTTCTVVAAQQSAESAAGIPAVLLRGTHASNVLDVLGGSVGVAYFGGETSTLATLDISGGSVICGVGVTLTTVNFSGGEATIQSSATTVNLDVGAGELDVLGGALSYTTINVYGGTLSYQAGGTITNLNVGLKGSADFSVNLQPRTVTNCTLYAGATLLDPNKTVTFTNGITLSGCRLEDVTLDLGVGRNLVVT